jgi:hypothetical protein
MFIQELLRSPAERNLGTGFPITDHDSNVFRFLRYLLQQHPEAATKFGTGISHFSIDFASVGGYPPCWHFTVHRRDGSETDFSYKKCLDNWGARGQFQAPQPIHPTAAAAAEGSSVPASRLEPLSGVFRGIQLSNSYDPQEPAERAARPVAAIAGADNSAIQAPVLHRQTCLRALRSAVNDHFQAYLQVPGF